MFDRARFFWRSRPKYFEFLAPFNIMLKHLVQKSGPHCPKLQNGEMSWAYLSLRALRVSKNCYRTPCLRSRYLPNNAPFDLQRCRSNEQFSSLSLSHPDVSLLLYSHLLLLLLMTHLQMLRKSRCNGGPIFKVVPEC